MKFRETPSDEPQCPGHSGSIADLLRSLVSGIPWSESADRVDTLQLSPSPNDLLRVRNASGRIEVTAEDRADVVVVATKHARAESREAAERLVEAIRISEGRRNGIVDLEVEVPRRWNRRGKVNLAIRVPRGLRLDCAAVNGNLLMCGLRARASARSSNGAVSIQNMIGDLEIFTSNAKITCSKTCGRLLARSSNGKIELVGHRGSLDASTSNGFIHATLDEVGEEGIRLATSNGRIVLELPDEVDADVDVRVDNGVIRSSRVLRNGSGARQGKLIGALGLGGTPIKIRTSNGSVSLR